MSPQTRTPSTNTGADALLSLMFGVLGAALAFGSMAWLTGNLTNALAGSGPWVPFRPASALFHAHALWPQLGPTAVLIGARILPGVLTAALVTTGLVLRARLRAGTTAGLARKPDLAPLLGREIAEKAQELRPSLADRSWKRCRSC